MPLSMNQMANALRKATGEDTDDLPNVAPDDSPDDPSAFLYLNKAYWEILEKYPFREKEKTVTFPTISDVSLYEVPGNLDYVRQISVEYPSTLQHVPLTQTTVLDYESEFSGASFAGGIPTHYVREGKAIRFYPTPDAGYNVILKYYMVLEDLGPTNQTPDVPQAWHEIIEYGAKWRRFADIGDYDRMQLNQSIAYGLLKGLKPTEAKELKDTKLAGLTVPRFENY